MFTQLQIDTLAISSYNSFIDTAFAILKTMAKSKFLLLITFRVVMGNIIVALWQLFLFTTLWSVLNRVDLDKDEAKHSERQKELESRIRRHKENPKKLFLRTENLQEIADVLKKSQTKTKISI